MANWKHPIVRSLFIVLFCASALLQGLEYTRLFCASALLQDATGSRVVQNFPTGYHISSSETEIKLKDKTKGSLIGSVAPTCTYNECRGCKYRCRAEQVPVEGNDPINSAYHYKCVCHR